MASRNNGEGPPNGKGAGGGPGSYVKVGGSRRRRGRRKQITSVHPPASPAALAEPLEPDPRAENERDDAALDEPFEPAGPSARDRRTAELRPASEAPSSVAQVRVVEINAPAHGSDNNNDVPAHDDRLDAAAPAMMEPRLAHVPAAMDEPFAPPSQPPAPAPAHDDDRYADDEELRAASEPPHAAPAPAEEPEPVPAARLVGHDPGPGFVSGRPPPEVEMEPQHGFSTVFHARPSLRPSPPPPPRSALGWWVVILLLSSIIGAAVVVAVRERIEEQAQPTADVPTDPPASSDTPPAPEGTPPSAPEPAAQPETPTVLAADAGSATAAADAAVAPAPAPKAARVWKPRPKALAADAGAGPRGLGKGEPAPVELVPANPYGRSPY